MCPSCTTLLSSLRQIQEQLDVAHKELCEAVKRQWDGKHAFRLSIPARPEHDTDLIIGEALRAARSLIVSLSEQKEQTEKEQDFSAMRGSEMHSTQPATAGSPERRSKE